jgi:hypothetical protein
MKILQLILVIVGIVLIAFGLYSAFVPQEVLDIGPLEVSAKEGLSTQTIAMIAIGAIALLAAAFMKRKA